MKYDEYFKLVDDYLDHLDQVLVGTIDPFFRSRYTGLLAVGAVTVYELAIKTILIEFAVKKHRVFGKFVEEHFSRLNGRIRLGDLRGQHVKRFGLKYVKRFNKKLKETEDDRLSAGEGSVMESYGNIITWRNEFAHQGQVPRNATYEEVRNSYQLGKEVIHCLADSMQR